MKTTTANSRTRKVFSAFAGSALLASTLLVSCNGGGTNLEIPNVEGPYVSIHEDTAIVTAGFTNLELQGGLRYGIPHYENSYIEIGPNFESQGTLLVIQLGMEDLLNDDLLLLEPQKLPGGQPIPGIRSGSLPAIAVNIQSFNNMTFYLGKDAVGIFVPHQLNIGVNNIITARFYDGQKVDRGTLSVVGPNADGEHSGFFLLMRLNQQIKNLMRQRIEMYGNGESDEEIVGLY